MLQVKPSPRGRRALWIQVVNARGAVLRRRCRDAFGESCFGKMKKGPRLTVRPQLALTEVRRCGFDAEITDDFSQFHDLGLLLAQAAHVNCSVCHFACPDRKNCWDLA